VAEYTAIIAVLRWIRDEHSADPVVRVYSDADVPVQQLRGNYTVRQAHLVPLHQEARDLLDGFSESHVSYQSAAKSSELSRADTLAKETTREDFDEH
jgi:ribonuclease HI